MITKAIIPVAGWGTRRLPITKSIEKCMLPVGNRPVIDYIVQDCIQAGITEFIFVVGEQSSQLQSYYRSNIPLKDYLKRIHRDDLLALIAPLKAITFHFVAQPSNGPYGTAVAAGLGVDYVEANESVLVIMGDQFFYREDGGSNAADMIALADENRTTAALFGNEIPWEKVSQFGIIEKDAEDNFVRIVEKPSKNDAPSNLNNSSFYLFDKTLLELAASIPPNPARGECEITDAINQYVAMGNKVTVGTMRGEYMECGSVEGWLAANNRIVGSDKA